jgi:hypothetical protein
MQAGITISVIDTALRFSQPVAMLNHDDILGELIRQLDAKMVKGRDVAAKLNIAPARITEMRKGGRRIQPNEMPILAKLLGLEEDAPLATTRIAKTIEIPHLGRVAQGIWLEQTFAEPDALDTVSYDMRPGDPGAADLFAVTPEGQSMNLRFPPGIQLICRRVPFGFAELRSGDLVVVERTNHDLREMTCKLLKVDADGAYWLHSESDQPQFQDPWFVGKPDDTMHIDTEIRVIGKVLRGVIDYS